MIRKVKEYLHHHQKQYELIRYLIAGGLTTVLSMIISYGCCFILAPKTPLEGSWLSWIVHTINQATASQVMLSNGVSWVIAVVFAFWINRKMVFRVRGDEGGVWKELGQFALGRVLSFLLFEEGMALGLKALGVSNVVNRLIVLVAVMVFNYVISKFWVFKGKTGGSSPTATEGRPTTEAKPARR